MTRPDDGNSTRTENRRTMNAVSHANPYTGETAGQLFSRGPAVVADGGRANAASEDETTDAVEGDRSAASDGEESHSRMRDVSHTPPNESEDANRVFERGSEGPRDGRADAREDRVAYEE